MNNGSPERGAAFGLLDAQDRERAALANTLHATILQSLAAAAMNLSVVETGDGARASSALADSVRLIKNSIVDVRAISYCAEPPFARDLGIKASLDAYARAFTRFHGVPFAVADLPPRCAGVRGDAAAAFVRSVRDASGAFLDAGAVAFRVGAVPDGDKAVLTLEVELPGPPAGTSYEWLVEAARERLRPFFGTADLKFAGGCARLVMRAGTRRFC